MMIGSKLLTFITQHLDIHLCRKFLWTDSSAALSWTKCNKDLPGFVRNRVRIIHENTTDVVLKHIPGNLNPADIGSRGASIQELLDSTSWWNGPNFLTDDDDSWPNDAFQSLPTTAYVDDDTHSTNGEPALNSVDLTFTASSKETYPLDAERFSSWQRMVNTMVYVLKFITMISHKARSYFGFFRTTHI